MSMRSLQRRFGIEEEFFLCNEKSGSLVRRRSNNFFRECAEVLGTSFSHEVLDCQIELKTPILVSAEQAKREIVEGRQKLIAIARRHGLRVLAAGTHPLAQWRLQSFSPGLRYDDLQRDFRIVAHRSLLCGLHVHVEVPETVDRIWLINEVMGTLPLLLSLSASSPYWSGQDTGLSSYRQSAYDEWPRTGIPPNFSDEKDYRRYVELLRRTQAISDESFIWWAIRPSSRYPTVELRITDSCPLATDALCIAEIFRAVVHQYVQEWTRGANLQPDPISRLVVEENRWRAKRFGTSARFINLLSESENTVRETIDVLRQRSLTSIRGLQADWAFDRAQKIVESGTSADRQRAVFDDAISTGTKSPKSALQAVVSALIAETAHEG